ncbi:MAG: 4-(cytidine 5'-diphospho)-2-C-methyl-D-erythritol kinase [Bacteroidota bacterium]
MIHLSPAKINIGLAVTGRREDGFHNLQSVMVPIGLCDILEIKPSGLTGKGLHFSQSGILADTGEGKNLCERAFEILSERGSLPHVNIHLHKQIPVGAGLGGGSSNATTTLLGLNRMLPEPLLPDQLHEMAAELGSDCPFFLHREPMLMEGRGEILSPILVDMEGLILVVLFPGIHSSTAEAYAAVTPATPSDHLKQLVAAPIKRWKEMVVNDFEKGIFRKYPELDLLKHGLYKAGALYASLSGSGSSLFGIFPGPPQLPAGLSQYVIWSGAAEAPPETI